MEGVGGGGGDWDKRRRKGEVGGWRRELRRNSHSNLEISAKYMYIFMKLFLLVHLF